MKGGKERKGGNNGKVNGGRGEGVKGHVDVWVKDVSLVQEGKLTLSLK